MKITRFFVKTLKKISQISKLRTLNKFANNIMMWRIYNKYHDKSLDYSNYLEKKESKYIWICWLQGFDRAPEIVKQCISSVERELGCDYKINYICEKNFKQFIKIDSNILDKYKKGIISQAQLSDIMRLELLHTYGGLWIDATIFIRNGDFIKKINPLDISSFKNTNSKIDSISEGKWSIYFLYAPKNSIHIKYMRDLIFSYWRREDYLFDYFLIDYVFGSTKYFDKSFNEKIDNNFIKNNERFLLDEVLESSSLVELSDAEIIGCYKLSHKKEYLKSPNDFFLIRGSEV